MQKQHAWITCKRNLFRHHALSQNNRFVKVFFKPQKPAKVFLSRKNRLNSSRNCSISVGITFDEMQSPFARFNCGRGLAVDVERDSAVSEGIHQILRLRAHHVWNCCTCSRWTMWTTCPWLCVWCGIRFWNGPRKLSLFVFVSFIVVI